MTTEVLIVGAGPTGLMLANQLNRFGIDFKVVDMKSGPTIQSRAMSVSSRSMEVYQQLGLADKIIEQSKEIQGITMVHNGKQISNFSLTTIGSEYCDFGRLTTTFEQNKNETLLYENIKDLGNVHWEYGFDSCEEHADGVITTIKHAETGATKTIQSKYIVGCDGARSAIRRSMNFSFEGGTYDNKFYVADVDLTWEYGYDNVVMMPEKGGFVALFSSTRPPKSKNYRHLA